MCTQYFHSRTSPSAFADLSLLPVYYLYLRFPTVPALLHMSCAQSRDDDPQSTLVGYQYLVRGCKNGNKGWSGWACPPGSCRHGGSPYKTISGYNVDIFARCAFQVPVRLFRGELCFVHVTAPGKTLNTLVGFAQLALMSTGTRRCQNRPI